MYGYMGKILRVNLSEGNVSAEGIREDWNRDFLGGIGIATKYLYSEVPKGSDPLGPENELIFMTGPLTGTISPSAGRYDVVAKSPLTGIWGEGTAGVSIERTRRGDITAATIDGDTIAFHYDEQNRLIEASSPEIGITRTYTGFGEVTTRETVTDLTTGASWEVSWQKLEPEALIERASQL